MAEANNTDNKTPSPWTAVTRARTPINVFALAIMACAAVLGGAASQIDNPCDLQAFTYTLHIFLAVTGMFFAVLLFIRRGIYHPNDLAQADKRGTKLGVDQPVLAAVFVFTLVAGYAFYQSKNSSELTASCAEYATKTHATAQAADDKN